MHTDLLSVATVAVPVDAAPSTLQVIWFCLVALLWTGYLVLEGFDFGVGALLPVLDHGTTSTTGTTGTTGNSAAARDDRRRVMLTTIGPHWDGNEVWLLTAGGSMFAAFPHWYATMFSALYLPLLLVLVLLILRNMGLEYRYKRAGAAWRRGWDRCIIAGSVLTPVLIGVALTNLVRGLPIDSRMEFTGNLLTLLNPLSLLGGIVVLGLSVTHGALFLSLKTTGDLPERARALATRTGIVTAVLAVVLLLWLGATAGTAASWVTTVLAAVALLGALALNLRGRSGLAFAGTALTIALAVATYFLELFPAVMPSTLAGGTSLTVANASSSPYTLQIMTVVAALFTPVVLAYTAWTYWVFRKRVGTAHLPALVTVH